MPLPRYSLDDGGGDEEGWEESYSSSATASSSRLVPTSSLTDDGNRFPHDSDNSGVVARRELSPSLSAYGEAPSSLDIDALIDSNNAPTSGDNSSSKLQSGRCSGWPYSASSPIASLSAFEQLTLFMATQKAAPELLPFPTTSFEVLVSQMEQQQSILDSLLDLPHSSTETEWKDGMDQANPGIDEDEFVRLNLVQVDLERSKWLLKHIVRIRIDLLQKYAAFIESREWEKSKLNTNESTFVTEYWKMKKDHFHSSVLTFLPDQLHQLNSGQNQQHEHETYQPNNSSNMVPSPDLDAPVFVRCLQDCGSIALPEIVVNKPHLAMNRFIY